MKNYSDIQNYLDAIPYYSISLKDIATPAFRTYVERYCESRCQYLPMPDSRVLCRVLGKYLMWVDAYDKGLSPHLIFQGYWEMWITSAIAACTNQGSTAIDIGANVGYYTMLLADGVGQNGKVIAFEPNPRIAEMLRMSLSINGYLPRTSVRSEAVSGSSSGSLTFAIPKYEPKNAGLVFSQTDKDSFVNQFGADVDFTEAKLISLDSMNLSNVGVVKVDAEGGEYEVWQGMQNTIEENENICIFLEFNASRSYDTFEFYKQIAQKFKVRHVDFDGQIKPLTSEMIASERKGDDWMLYLSKR
jgi:FkbM family methyltransferase